MVIVGVDFLFMMVFPEQEVPHLLPVAINHSFGSLNEDWCYKRTRFTVDQLHTIHKDI